MLLSLALLPLASAFCGTFVGAPGASLTNASSQVVLARQGTRTTLTVLADYRGDLAEFALVLPVPEVLGPEDVALGDEELLTWIEQYGTPRAVSYTCEDLFDLQHTGLGCGYAFGCSDSSVGGLGAMSPLEYADESVTVESEFSVGAYDIVVLSAEESSDLFTWLRNNDYELPRGGDDILQAYIDAGTYFLAARIALDAPPTSGNTWLPPLRLSYEAETIGLPIRIGTINADGPQEVLIHALTDVSTDGEVGIANYPEVEVERECMWIPEDGEDMAGWYGRMVEDGVEDAGGAGWIKEYSADLVPTEGQGYHCDPCTAEPAIPGGTFAPFGLDSDSAHLTRIRMRYEPEAAVEDLTLYTSGILGASSQLRYVTYEPELEFAFPVCHEGWVDNPGECPNDYVAGCTAPVRMSGLGVLVALVALRRRAA